jgi:CheY-like chemotaxis protein
MAAKILVVDDEPDLRTYLRTLFTKEGYEVQTAENGEIGLQRAREVKPDLIFCDILMPKRSGIMLYRQLRKDADLGDVPVVIMTGLSEYKTFFAQDIEQLPEPDAFVEKPPARDKLIELASGLIGGTGSG